MPSKVSVLVKVLCGCGRWWLQRPNRRPTRRCTRPPTASAFARASLQPTLPAAG